MGPFSPEDVLATCTECVFSVGWGAHASLEARGALTSGMQTWMTGPRSSPAQAPSRCWLRVGEALSTPKTGPVSRGGLPDESTVQRSLG